MDIASLAIAVDSRPARTAADDLDRLTGAGARTEKAMAGVGAGGKTAAAGSAAAATGSRAATSAMDAQAASAQRLTAAIRSYAVIAVSGMSAMGLVDAADQWGQMASRIRMATKSVEEYDRVQARMVVSATTTYRSITETREAFIQMSPVLRQMGMSLDESMDAIDAFSGLMVTNAASTERGTAAMRALSISMQKGKMDADQWITIYSSLDSIVDTIAAHSGMAAEEIRRLGAEGKLSVSLIAQALAGQLAPIMAQVEEMPTTVRDAMQRVSTAFTEYVGKANEANGVTATMAEGISFLGDNLTAILNVALIAGGSAFARYAAAAIAAGAQSAINAALARAQAAEELKLAQAHVAVTTAAVAQARASALLAGGMAQQTAATVALTAAQQRLAVAQAATAAASRGMLAILGGPVGVAITAGLAATAFMTMGGSADAASVNIDTLASSLGELSRKQLELRQFELEDVVKSLESQAAGSGAILRTLQADIDALTARYGAYSEGMDGARRSLLEQEEAHNQNLASLDKAQSLLNQVTGRMQDLDGAARGAAGGVNTLNAAMSFTEAGEKYLGQIQNRIKALQDGGDPVKAATRWTLDHADASESDKIAIMSAALAEKALQDARERATRSTKSSKSAIDEAKKAAEAFGKEREKHIQSQYEEIGTIGERAQAMEREVELYGQSESAIIALTIADLEQQKAAFLGIKGAEEQITIRERMIEQYQRIGTAMAGKEFFDKQKKDWDDWSQDVGRIFQNVGQSLTDAIFDGGKSGKELLKDVFKGLTFSIAINPIMNAIQGGVTSSLGGLFGFSNPAAGASGGAGGGMLGNAGSLFSMFGGNSMGMGASNLLSNVASSNMLAGTGVGNYLTGLSGNVAGMSNLALGGAGLLGGLGAGLIFDGEHSGMLGGLGSTAGMMLGGPLGAVAGSLLGGAVGSLFGSGPPKTRHGQRTTIDMMGGNFGVSGVDGRQAAGAEQAALAAAESSVKAANDLFARIGVNAGIESFYAIMESSVLGDRDGVASGGSLRVGDQMRNFGVSQASDMTLAGVGGWSDAEMLPRLQADIQLSVLEAFQSVGAQLPRVLADMVSGVDIRSLDATAAQQLAEQFTAITQSATALQQAVELLPFENLRDLSFDAAAGLIAAAGGLENLNTGLSSYYQNFYSQEEQLALSAKNIETALSGVGLAMPDVTSGATAAKDAFRSLFESLDPATESGAAAIATMLGVNESFAQLVTGMEQLNGVTSQTAAAIAQQRLGLENQLLQLQGNTVELRKRELAALDPTNQALQERIWALTDQAAITSERLGLEGQLLQLQGDTTEIRRRELEALDPANRELQEHIWLLGDAASARQKDIDALKTARTAAETAAANAMAALTASVNASKSELQKAFSDIADVLNTSISASKTAIGTLESMAGRLRSTLDSMAGRTDERQSREWAQAQIAMARAAGVAPSGADFEQALSIVAQPSEGLFATFEDYQLDFLKTANDIFALGEITDKQLTVEQRTLNALEDQLKAEKDNFDQQMAKYDDMLTLAQQQIDVAMGIDKTLLTIPDALAAIAAAIAGLTLTAPASYLSQNPDVAAAYANGSIQGNSAADAAAQHYAQFGAQEGRSGAGIELNPALSYIANNPDVAAQFASYGQSQGMDLEQYAAFHYAMHGKDEGRSFAVGTNYVPYDMQANIHEGERIIPKADNRALFSALSNPHANNAVLSAAVERLTREVEGLRADQKASQFAIAKNTQRTARNTEDTSDAMRNDETVVLGV